MIKLIKKMFGGANDSEVNELLRNGAIILDVRTAPEFTADHIPAAKHIALGEILRNLNKIKKWGKPVVVYCRFGRRSGIATQQMKKAGIKAYNGGGIDKMRNRLKQI